MICKTCQYQFYFDPKKFNVAGRPLTDNFFLSLVATESRNGTYFFTREEFYRVAESKSWTRRWIPGLVATILVSFPLLMVYEFFPVGLFPYAALALFIGTCVAFAFKPLHRGKWESIVNAWQRREAIPLLLETPSLETPPAGEVEPDVHTFGVASLLICEEDLQVDWLVRNRFHEENGMLVVSETGYPSYAAEKAAQQIRLNPNLRIFVLHRSSKEGERMVERVRSSDRWGIPAEREVIDLGLSRSMLGELSVPRRLNKVYKDGVPPHALPYHGFHALLAASMVEGQSLAETLMAASEGGGVEFSMDGGDFG